MTAQALAEHLEVSERTIYRDIEALSFAGIPLYTERGPGGGCELLDGYQTRLTGLTEPEVRALFLLSAFAPLADLSLDQALEDALLKLSAALPAASREHAAQVRQRIYLDTTGVPRSRPGLSHLEVLQEAIWHDYTLHLTCGGYDRRSIDPYGLVLHHGAWYLVGASAGTVQAVRVAHIQTAELTGQHFTRPAEFDLATSWAEHVSLTACTPKAGRGRRILKKAGMKAAGSTPTGRPPQRNHHTAFARNKKKAIILYPSPSHKKDLAPRSPVMVAA